MDSDSDDVWAPDSPQPKAKKVVKKAPAAKKAAATKKAAAARKPVTKKKKTSMTESESESDMELMDSEGGLMDDGSNEKQSIEQIYQKKSQLQHILLRPDTYVGSIEPVTQSMWVFDEENKKMEFRKITFVPGLYKIFDEIIVNACDNKQRDRTMDTLRVTIDAENGEISVWNNGKGIPVALHKEHKIYVPELIFGNLLTGSNFDDKKKKTVGGRNGFGAKLANIFSTQFTVETADASTKQRYKQVFSNNMSDKGTPTITKWTKKDFTCITFKPDFERFKVSGLDSDIVSLFKKRVYDVAGVTDKSLNVYLNDDKISVKSFPDYVAMYKSSGSKGEGDDDDNDDDDENSGERGSGGESVIFDKPDGRWQVGVGVSDDGFQQVSFVNGICTTKGGQHVNYIADQVVAKLIAVVKKRNKGEAVKPNYIKNHMCVYVSALIDNPAFDSQTKETLTTRPPSFGSTYTLSDKLLKQIEKSGMVQRILSFAQYKQTAELRRKGGSGVKKSKLTGITKLDDANHAGTAKGKNCTLILTEGDSAKSLAISGLSVVGRDSYGVFPLKGKLLNVREASHSQILKNEEIQNLVKILGLKYGQKYDSTKSLRYGHLMIMADQDHDGSHIKGLVINFIHHFWPSLLEIEGFLLEFITPIVKVTKNRVKKVFYTMPEYEAWRDSTNNGRGWTIKYYKGLGTSSAQEAKEYFSDLGTHQIGFVYTGDADGDSIDMAFSKKRVEDRKDWLRGYEVGTHVDYDVEEMDYSEFVNKELILFSMADNLRSIPSLVDGFKPSQRKVLFSCFKRNLKVEIKVVQLAGYVSEHSAYHHGEASLYGTIINLAQDFVGSNNVHLLTPSGQFGTRLLGGKDAASPRYIFTNLEPLARRIYDPLDNDILNYLNDDGQPIEPEWYIPIIPMILVNGNEGIGTGWSSSLPNYNPLDIIRNLRHKINNEALEQLKPWYRDFSGQIIEKTTGKTSDSFVVQGTYEIPDETTLIISELPVKTWTQSYKQFLETLVESGTVQDFKENHTDTRVLFTITLAASTLRDIVKAPGGVVKKFKLETTISTSNMHLFDAEGRIKKYESPLEILNEFYDIRLEYYDKRKVSMLQKLAEQVKILSNKTRFILAVIDGSMVINNRKKSDILLQLSNDGYDQVHAKTSKRKSGTAEENDESASDEEKDTPSARGYDYLLSMKLLSLTKERVEKLKAELREREEETENLENTSIQELWLADLEKLEQLIIETEDERVQIATSAPSKKRGGGRRGAGKKRAKKRKSSDEDSDSDFEFAAKPKVKQRTQSSTAVTKARPVVKKEKSTTKPITAFFGSKETPKPKTEVKKEEPSDDLEVMSLAERLARRVQVTPPKAPKSLKPAAKKATVAVKRAKKTNVVDLASSDESGAGSEDGESDDDVFSMSSKKPSKPRASAANLKAAPAKKDKQEVLLSDSEPPVKPKGALKRRSEKSSASTDAPMRSSPAPKKQKRLQPGSDEEDEDVDDDMGADTGDNSDQGRRRRGGRVRNRIVYTEIMSDVDDDDSDDAAEEEAASDDDSEFE